MSGPDQRSHGDKAESETKRDLYQAMLLLRSVDDCERFLADLCTPAELKALAGRWQVARLLDRGIPYREIYEATGVSTATVTRVARCLVWGESGYRRVLERLRKTGKD